MYLQKLGLLLLTRVQVLNVLPLHIRAAVETQTST